MRKRLFILFLLFAAKPSIAASANLAWKAWNVDGVNRMALVYLPAGARTAPCPVVFAFHGHGGTAQQAAAMFACHRHWPEAIVVYLQGMNSPGVLNVDPEGREPGWQYNLGDQHDRDLKCFDTVFASLKQDYQVDAKRIYATGHSNGGSFTYLLWAARGDALAAVAPCGTATLVGDMELPAGLPFGLGPWVEGAKRSMKTLKPKPVMHVAGENDPLVAVQWQKLTMAGLRKFNGCEEGKPWDKYCTIYPSKSGTPVVTCIYPGGHMLTSDVPPLIVRFFQKYAKP